MTIEPEQAELLAEVAHLYFEKGEDQSAIARRLRVSRSSISRLLTQARRQGIVEIRIHYPLALAHESGDALRERFGLKEALVLRSARPGASDTKTQLARLAARYLEEHIAPGDVVAISRGTTLHSVVEQFNAAPRRNVRVVQLVGTLRVASAPGDDANLARALAQKVGGEYYNLTAPLFVENVETRRALVQEPAIRQVLDLARHANLALVGIGALDRRSSSILKKKLLPAAQIQELRQGQAVGEICSQYFDTDGCIVSRELSERTLAVELDALRAGPCVVGVAAGIHKVKAIRGALRGGYLGVLITDEPTAQHILDVERQRPRSKQS
jgi:DNA-binding transcriptional regulator LsrR (DeoR family)